MTRQPPNELEKTADRLLAEAGCLGRRRGIYSEASLRRKIARDRRRQTEIDESAMADCLYAVLVDKALGELVEAARLSVRQDLCFRLHLCGMSPGGIARRLNVRRQVVQRRLDAALRRIRRAYYDGPYAGWYEVYLAEVNRPVYRGRSRIHSQS